SADRESVESVGQGHRRERVQPGGVRGARRPSRTAKRREGEDGGKRGLGSAHGGGGAAEYRTAAGEICLSVPVSGSQCHFRGRRDGTASGGRCGAGPPRR